ncbi:hypothetical protein H2198_005019 [Neophaeococcomyces mojaviensis]|uniref:Uncharacterized protein n=1 Tax=Neophaeococcomyces mojaviensis TaxID=3383035 RepID=A0ACC3A6U6_9EURO|nr:hypothetical protein H2198_005019 [Knufia sp. JES_112]
MCLVTDMTMEYEDSNRAFVQAFLARNVLTFDQAKPILAAIFSVHEKKQVDAADINKEDFDSMVSAANAALSPLDFEIRSADDQETRETFYALVNTTSDALTQLATIHSSDEIGYVKRLLDEIFETSNTQRREAMCIAGKDALNLARAGRRATQNDEQTQPKFSLTAHEVETLLTKLVAEGWLDKSAKGFYSLSIRGLMELKGWLVETYNDPVDEDGEAAYQKIKFCHACKGIITKGQRCSDLNCLGRLHDICTQQSFRARQSRTCPVCNREWDGKHYVGEKAITTSDSYLRGKRRSGARAASEAGDEEEEM